MQGFPGQKYLFTSIQHPARFGGVQQQQLFKSLPLKGPKHEIFVAGIFTHIRPVWVGDLGTAVGQKIQKVYGWGLIFTFLVKNFYFCAVTYSYRSDFE
jgi:hypothetical protein